MTFNIYDTDLNFIGAISNVVSSTWSESYSDRGICQLVTVDTAALSQMLQVGYFVGCSGHDTLWQIKTKEKQNNQLWLNGFTANYTLLFDRVYDGIHNSSNVEDDLRAAVLNKRPAPIVGLGVDNGLTGAVVSQHTYPTIWELAKDLCGAVDYGFRFKHDRASKKLLFEVYNGVEQPNAVFAEKFGNLANVMLQQSDVDFKNVAYVGGAGEDVDRIYTTCGAVTSTGMARHEMFVDARDLQKEDGQSDAAYIELLKQRGLQALNENNQKIVISFDVDASQFGKTFNLGDKITCLLPEDMIKLEARVIEFTEVAEQDKNQLTIKVGSPIIQTIGG